MLLQVGPTWSIDRTIGGPIQYKIGNDVVTFAIFRESLRQAYQEELESVETKATSLRNFLTGLDEAVQGDDMLAHLNQQGPKC